MASSTPHRSTPTGPDRRTTCKTKGELTVRLRKRLLFPLLALLGAAVVVLPALAASSQVKLEVNENCNYPNWPCWTSSSGSDPPPAGVVTIAQGGVLTFVDKTSVAVNLAWTGATPTCSAAVPVSPMPAQSGWEGTCTFEAPGHYKLESSTLYPSYRSYEIVVQAPGTTGASTTGTTTGSSTPYGSGNTPSGSGAGSGAASPQSGPAGTSVPLGSLLAGSDTAALELAGAQHGRAVHGSVKLTQAAAGGRLELQLFAIAAALGGARHASDVQVGLLTRSPLQAGTEAFTIALDARARRALRIHGHLALSVKITVAPAHGSPLTITRAVVVRG
jgi:hypothetical protein